MRQVIENEPARVLWDIMILMKSGGPNILVLVEDGKMLGSLHHIEITTLERRKMRR